MSNNNMSNNNMSNNNMSNNNMSNNNIAFVNRNFTYSDGPIPDAAKYNGWIEETHKIDSGRKGYLKENESALKESGWIFFIVEDKRCVTHNEESVMRQFWKAQD